MGNRALGKFTAGVPVDGARSLSAVAGRGLPSLSIPRDICAPAIGFHFGQMNQLSRPSLNSDESPLGDLRVRVFGKDLNARQIRLALGVPLRQRLQTKGCCISQIN